MPAEALGLAKVIKAYKKIQHDFHKGTILPIGDEPSGRSWTGFQSIHKGYGYLLVFREKSATTRNNKNLVARKYEVDLHKNIREWPEYKPGYRSRRHIETAARKGE
ncbi:hypothetical protein LWM68_17930 [Niabella sp. W65]|nr:hypothetical protein [Niabella sp. W65]MCH7364461.1 hypothetical protein [Niabella sp. W65]